MLVIEESIINNQSIMDNFSILNIITKGENYSILSAT
jgi:hypothetical protein